MVWYSIGASAVPSIRLTYDIRHTMTKLLRTFAMLVLVVNDSRVALARGREIQSVLVVVRDEHPTLDLSSFGIPRQMRVPCMKGLLTEPRCPTYCCLALFEFLPCQASAPAREQPIVRFEPLRLARCTHDIVFKRPHSVCRVHLSNMKGFAFASRALISPKSKAA